MTRLEHLEFCKQCTNRKMDLKQGVLCGLTDRIADFDPECPDYKLDEEALAPLDNEIPLESSQIVNKLSDNALAKLKAEQNLPLGIFIGISAGVLGAILWGVITVVTGYQIGYMAIGIGALVGISIRIFGKGMDPIFGIAGAIIAIGSCFIGNFLGILGFVSESENLSYFDTLFMFDYSQFFSIMFEVSGAMDLFFYAIAAYEGYKFAFRQFTEEDVAAIRSNEL